MARPDSTSAPHFTGSFFCLSRVLWVASLVLLAAVPATIADWSIVSATGLGEPAPGMEIIETHCVNGTQTARVTALCFNDKNHTLRVIDSPSPGSATLANTLRNAKVLGGVNGGYFHEDFRPVGLVISDGKTLNGFERAKLLSGVVGVKSDGHVSILRSGDYDSAKFQLHQAIQCGPMLVEDGHAVAGLNGDRIARRTVVAKGMGGQAALVYISSVSLADAARILALPSILDTWKPQNALNLDGGSSSGLWACNGVSLSEIARVRNFLAIVPR
ncbi:MAG: phosphodiester glycosidase family protein [bacterium]